MIDQHVQAGAPHSNEMDPATWVTGDEAMTGALRSPAWRPPSGEARVACDESLTRAQASVRTDERQEMTGRGRQD